MGTFGSTCNTTMSTSQCNTGLVCSTIGNNIGYCLYDIGVKCANDNDCANLLHCQLDSTCGCNVINSTHMALNGEHSFFTLN